MNYLKKLVSQFWEGSIDKYSVFRAIDVAFIRKEITSDEYMNLMDMVND